MATSECRWFRLFRVGASAAIALTAGMIGLCCGGESRGDAASDGSVEESSDVNAMGAIGKDAGVKESGSIGDGAVGASCRSNDDCSQQGFSVLCLQCADGGRSCSSSQCGDAGVCQGVGPRTCDVLNTCQSCGATCQTCNTVDGGCYSGFCDVYGGCRPSRESCPGAIPAPSPTIVGCGAFDARGVGDCDSVFGWAWDGSKCVAVVGCVCEGSDCQIVGLLEPFFCEAFISGCLGDASTGSVDGSVTDGQGE